MGLGETNLGGFILMTSFSNSSTISLLRLTRDPQAIIVVDGGGENERRNRRGAGQAKGMRLLCCPPNPSVCVLGGGVLVPLPCLVLWRRRGKGKALTSPSPSYIYLGHGSPPCFSFSLMGTWGALTCE
jgi:hypothetical protein